MARDHARIFVAIWGDRDFRALNRDEQRMYFTLVSQSTLTYCGSLDFIPSRLAILAADEDEMTVEHSIKLLEAARFLVIDRTTQEILIRSFVRHDGLLDSPNMTKAMLKARSALLSDDLRNAVDSELWRAHRDNPKRKGWPGLKEAAPELFRQVSAKGSGNPFEKGQVRG